MAKTYCAAPEVEEIAERLLDKAMHSHLIKHECQIRYLFQSEADKKGDHTVLGTARVVRGWQAKLAGSDDPFFLILIAQDEWETMKPRRKEFIVNHELTHCFAELKLKKDAPSEVVLSIKEHDIEHFYSDYQDYGRDVPGSEPLYQVIIEQGAFVLTEGDAEWEQSAHLGSNSGITSIAFETGDQRVELTPEQFDRAVDRLTTTR